MAINRERPYYIYEFVDPRTDVPGYVGITNNPKHRQYQHLALRDGNSKKISWVLCLAKEGVKPVMRKAQALYRVWHSQEEWKAALEIA